MPLTILAALAVGLGSIAVWLVVYGLALLATRAARPRPAPATMDLPGNEPPAVVSLLTNYWEITVDAAESTLIDLAARRFLEFRQPGNDPMQTTVHVRDPQPAGLNPYEQLIFDRVARLAVHGVVPLTALTFRDTAKSREFEKRLRAEVLADARQRGLSRRRFGRGLRAVLDVAAAAAGVGVAVATSILIGHTQHAEATQRLKAGGVIGLMAFVILAGVARRWAGDRDTAAGREACARWLGVQEWLRRTEEFDELPPAAVAVWDRYLAYGDAVGAARVCAAVIDLGMGDRKRVWSSYGGTWHRVRVRYPKFWAHYGKPLRRPVVEGVIVAIVGSVLLARFVPHHGGVLGEVLLSVAALLLVRGVYLLARAAVDAATPVAVTGQVLWQQLWRSQSRESGSNRPILYYFAVDDGSGDLTTAWALPAALHGRAADGDTVEIRTHRWTRRIDSVTVLQAGAMRQADAIPAMNPQTRTMVEDYLGAATRARTSRASTGASAAAATLGAAGTGAAGTGAAGTAVLVTAEEVGRVLGAPVTARAVTPAGAGRRMPVAAVRFAGPGEERSLQLVTAGGLAAQLLVRTRRGQPVPGLGDEAYAGNGWVIGLRGGTAVMAIVPSGQWVDPSGLRWLVSLAVGRLPTAAAPYQGNVP